MQEDTLGSPFKVSNLGAPVGTITDDRLTGITGSFGRLPAAADIVSNATFGDTSRQGSTEVNLDEYTPDLTFYQTMVNQEAVTDGWIGGSAEQSWTIVGTDATGTQFSLSYADRFTSGDITYTSVWDVADIVWAISRQPGVDIAAVRVDADITTEEDTLRVSTVEQRRGGGWQRISRRSPAVVAAGGDLSLRITMVSPRGNTVTTRSTVAVPRRASGQRAYLQVNGGQSFWSNAAYKNGLSKIIRPSRASPATTRSSRSCACSSRARTCASPAPALRRTTSCVVACRPWCACADELIGPLPARHRPRRGSRSPGGSRRGRVRTTPPTVPAPVPRDSGVPEITSPSGRIAGRRALHRKQRHHRWEMTRAEGSAHEVPGRTAPARGHERMSD